MSLPDNGSGYAGGTYASPEQTAAYLSALDGYLAKRNAAWLDRVQHRHSGEFPEGTPGEIINRWRADSHLVKWAISNGLLDPSSIKRDGLQHRQIGRLTAIIYGKDMAHRRALTWELAAYIDRLELEAIDRVSVCTG